MRQRVRFACFLMLLFSPVLLQARFSYPIHPGWNLIAFNNGYDSPMSVFSFAAQLVVFDADSQSYFLFDSARYDPGDGLWVLSDRDTTVTPPHGIHPASYFYNHMHGWRMGISGIDGVAPESIVVQNPGYVVPGTIYLWEPGPGAHYRQVLTGERIDAGRAFWMLMDEHVAPPATLPPYADTFHVCGWEGKGPLDLDSIRITVDRCKVRLNGYFEWNCGVDTAFSTFGVYGDTLVWNVDTALGYYLACDCHFPVTAVWYVDHPGEYLLIVSDNGIWRHEERFTVTDCP